MESWWTPEILDSDFKVKIQWLVEIFILLESSWSVDV
jgi:hypothetical protein